MNLNPKSEVRNPKQYRMTKSSNSKQYDLEDRTLAFAKNVRSFELMNILGAILRKSEQRFDHLNLCISDLFRVSCFVLRN